LPNPFFYNDAVYAILGEINLGQHYEFIEIEGISHFEKNRTEEMHHMEGKTFAKKLTKSHLACTSRNGTN